jgi:drug/metabolite transporter (DMT)-like permease
MSVDGQRGFRQVKRQIPGAQIAGATALISGVSVFVNSYGVRAVASPAVYTTAKNLVATLVLGGAALVARRVRARRVSSTSADVATPSRGTTVSYGPKTEASSFPAAQGRHSATHWLGLAYVGVVGGGLAFVLFFNGLAQSAPAPAAFWRDTLVLWVAVLAVPFLRERVRWWNVAAVALLIVGEITLTGGVGRLGASRGELSVLAATVLWAVEVVIAKRLLRGVSPAALGVVRMGVGGSALIAYLAATGSLGALVSLNASQIGWVLWTGLLLSAYVATWMTALARARALDVTSVLVASALITWLLQLAAGTITLARNSLGLVLIALGALLVSRAMMRRAPRSELPVAT